MNSLVHKMKTKNENVEPACWTGIFCIKNNKVNTVLNPDPVIDSERMVAAALLQLPVKVVTIVVTTSS